jgi:hypothetical protein
MGASLVRKIFCKKDYVEVIPAIDPQLDNEKINFFLERIRNQRGRIIRIQGMEKVSTDYSDGQYVEAGFSTSSENSYLIHYKCYRQIRTTPTKTL